MNKTRVIQGLNLESQYSIVKIPLEGENIEEISTILEKIDSFHPLFIKEYTLSSTGLTISSKLSHLWNEASETLQKLATKEISLEKADEQIIQVLIKKKIKSMSTIPVLQAAEDLNIEITPALQDNTISRTYEEGYSGVFNRYYTLGSGKGSQISGSIASSKDAHIAQRLQRDKWSTNTLIENLNLPIPKWQAIHTQKELEEAWDGYEKPVVIKPTGLVGGKGVTVGIDTLEQAKKAYKFAKDLTKDKASTWQRKIMIQEQITGEDYRLLVVNGKLEIATKRIPAFIIGNGKSTIQELLDETNSDPRRDTYNPAHVLKPIEIDQPLLNLLKEQNLTLDSVLATDEKLNVRKIASMSRGGVTEDYTDQVGSEIRIIAETLAQSLHAYVLGVDVMCNDISKPLTKENGAILEVNTMPEAFLNFYPTIGKQREYVAQTYVKGLLDKNNTQQFVVIGESINDIPTLLRKKRIIQQESHVGELKDSDYIIDGKEINKIKNRWEATSAIKRNAALDTIILHFRDWNEAKEYGLGFDRIDTLFVTKSMTSNKEAMKTVKRYKRIKLINKIKKI